MSRRRFHVPVEVLEARGPEGRVALGVEESRHLRDVLRLRAGDEAYVFDGAGREYVCEVVETGRGAGAAILEVRGEVGPPRPESPLTLTLAVALLKGEKFDLVVQKATELGVTGIVPVITKRADVRPRDASDLARRLSRWRRLALEAAKQSGRALVPSVAEPVELSRLVAPDHTDAAGASRLMFAERDGASLAEAVGTEPSGTMTNVTALVGPEGGWEDAEIDAARAGGWRVVTLGGRTLRAETAALAVAVLLQHLRGDLR